MTALPVPYDRLEVLYPADAIAERVKRLAQEIHAQLPPDIMVIALLRGSFVFVADLIRAMQEANPSSSTGPQIDFMTLGSYGNAMTSSGTVQIIRDLADPVKHRDVLIVDDILESGRTLTFAKQLIETRGARSVHIAVLLEKPGKRKVAIEADFVGFTIPDRFVVGYGLDYANYYRELPFIGVVPNGY